MPRRATVTQNASAATRRLPLLHLLPAPDAKARAGGSQHDMPQKETRAGGHGRAWHWAEYCRNNARCALLASSILEPARRSRLPPSRVATLLWRHTHALAVQRAAWLQEPRNSLRHHRLPNVTRRAVRWRVKMVYDACRERQAWRIELGETPLGVAP